MQTSVQRFVAESQRPSVPPQSVSARQVSPGSHAVCWHVPLQLYQPDRQRELHAPETHSASDPVGTGQGEQRSPHEAGEVSDEQTVLLLQAW